MVKADLAASNGVIHTISGVLEPLGLNHLYFRFITGEYDCAQVDAGPAGVHRRDPGVCMGAQVLRSPPRAWDVRRLWIFR